MLKIFGSACSQAPIQPVMQTASEKVGEGNERSSEKSQKKIAKLEICELRSCEERHSFHPKWILKPRNCLTVCRSEEQSFPMMVQLRTQSTQQSLDKSKAEGTRVQVGSQAFCSTCQAWEWLWEQLLVGKMQVWLPADK